MSFLHGIYLIATLACAYYLLYKHLSDRWKPLSEKEASYKRRIWIDRAAKIAAFLIILAAWWFQNEYRHHYSREAIAMKTFDKLLDDWDAGNKDKVLRQLDSLAGFVRPWHSSDGED